MNYMWDDLVSASTTTPATPAHSVQQRERCPGRVCSSASRDTYDAEVCHGGEILYFVPRQQTKKEEKSKVNYWGKEKEEGEKKPLTRERRTDFSPADISKVQQHALLQRVKNISARYRIW
jgi:hypothetical protein